MRAERLKVVVSGDSLVGGFGEARLAGDGRRGLGVGARAGGAGEAGLVAVVAVWWAFFHEGSAAG